MGSIAPPTVRMIDIRGDKTNESLLDILKHSLVPKDSSPPSLPTLLLYDAKGLKLFEAITYLDEYYLTNAEIQALSKYADEIAARIPAGTRLVELGSGNLRKVDILLQAFEAARKPIDYYALDLSLSELERTFAEIDPSRYQYVSLNALHGTYDDGLVWVADALQSANSTCILTLGSSMGNFHRHEAASFLKNFQSKLGPSDSVLVGLDACEDEERIFRAYNDSKGVTESFYRNGLDHANRLLGYEAFKQSEWKVEGSYDRAGHHHRAAYLALTKVQNPDFTFERGQRVLLEYAYKYTKSESDQLWQDAGLKLQTSYSNDAGNYNVHLLSPHATNAPSTNGALTNRSQEL